jgi:hypothetical protein
MYLDPGFGSLVLQYILAGLLGAGIIVRLFWSKIKHLFQGKQTQESEIKDDIDYSSTDES